MVRLSSTPSVAIPPLHLALYYKDEAKAKALIEAGADVNERTRNGTSPLHRAIKAGFTDIAQLLIEKGADVNAKSNWGWTPLHAAVCHDHQMVSVLVAKGANLDARDGSTQTPLNFYTRAFLNFNCNVLTSQPGGGLVGRCCSGAEILDPKH